MKQEIAFKHEFVEFVPEELKEETLYISIRFATVSHLCACGCKSKVVTPLRPTDWKLIFDGKTISLYPSVGSWSFPCRSHYWVRNNKVQWAEQWSQVQMDVGRAHDRRVKERSHSLGEVLEELPMPAHKPETAKPGAAENGFWQKLQKKPWG
ncbi:MAG: DUF6527 family protein [Bryobacteraceae bacterium]|jgi:hypothetical protein